MSGQLLLRFDPDLGLFVTGAVIGTGPASADGVRGSRMVSCDLVIDTGSTHTSLNEETAADLGLRPLPWETRPMIGIGGLTETPIVRDVALYFAGGEVATVGLAEVGILRRPRRRRTRALGRRQSAGGEAPFLPNILGLDALDALGDVLHLEVSRRRGWIDF